MVRSLYTYTTTSSHPLLTTFSKISSSSKNQDLMAWPSSSSSSSSSSLFSSSLSTTTTTIKSENEDEMYKKGEDRSLLLKVCILGPPNAGKSTLFNRLLDKRFNYQLSSEKKNKKKYKKKQVKKHQAIVSSIPGTTRDRREGLARIGSVPFQIVDTAGVDKSSLLLQQKQQSRNKKKKNQAEDEELLLSNQMVLQSIRAMKESDLILLVLDARYSNLYMDAQDILPLIRRHFKDKRIIVLANKLEGWSDTNDDILESIHQLQQYVGSSNEHQKDENVLIISAEHGDGMAELAVQLQKETRKKNKEQMIHNEEDHEEEDEEDEEEMEKPIPVAIVGRPNVGKSTLMNALLGEERVIASAMPGTTRDAISIEWNWRDHPIKLVDTAGLTKFHALAPQREDIIEDAAIHNALRAIHLAHVVILVIDVSETMFRRFELTLAQRAVMEEGRSLIICANKMDLIVNNTTYTHTDLVRDVQNQLGETFPALRNTPVIATSSLYQPSHHIRDELIMPQIIQTRQRWSNKIPTATMNRWLQHALEIQPSPIPIKYVIQSKGRPPTFLFFGNFTSEQQLPMSYIKYLQRSLQENFNFHGMSLRLVMKSSKKDNNSDRIVPTLRKKNNAILKGTGGREGRKKRMTAALKQTGSTPRNLKRTLQRQKRKTKRR